MDSFSKPPGGESKPTSFPHCKTARGKFWDAWYAGAHLGIYSHGGTPTKPCAHNFTNGAVKCPLCGPTAKLEWRCYVALYREQDARPVSIIVGRDQWDRVRSFRLHERVRIGRNSEVSDGVWIMKRETGAAYQTTIAERQVPADLLPTCLAFWKMETINQWVARRRGKVTTSDNALSLGEAGNEHLPLHPQVATELAEQIIRRRMVVKPPDPPLPATLGDALESVVGHLPATPPPEPSSNGKHPRKKNGCK